MPFPLEPPIEPMLAKALHAVPDEGAFLFEPKWDGFRALVFRDHDELFTQSREKKPLDRYFPELREPFLAALPPRCVVDGEVIIPTSDGLDFGALQQRIHPAKSRVEMLAEKTPAAYVVFDLLALDDEDLTSLPVEQRRARLEQVLEGAKPPVYLTPMTRDRDVATDWFHRFEGAGLDGVIAKPLGGAYEPKKRKMLKIKHRRTVDCAVAGFRWHKKGPGTLVGSLLLGLFGDDGQLHHVGITASFTMKRRAELLEELEPLRADALTDHPWASWARAEEAQPQRKPGMTSRWNAGKNLSWEPLRVERVVEVAYDHLQGSRFRHATTFVRWRDDREPSSCTYEQCAETPAVELREIFRA